MDQIGNYQIQEELGRGGMAVVYKALDTQRQRPVALKVLFPHLSSNPDLVRRFKREAEVASRLNHDNIVRIYDVGEEDGLVYFAMQYLPGRTLKQVISEGGPLSLERATNIIHQLASALDHAHAKGLVHRDIKPSNIMVDAQDHVTLTDFGIVRAAGETRLTLTGGSIGTPEYMSPEQALGRRQIDGRSDIYSLGILLYEMLTGRLPFTADSTPAILHKQVYEPVTIPQRMATRLPQGVQNIIRKAMTKNPDDRFSQAGELAQTLEAVSQGQPFIYKEPVTRRVTPTPVPPPDRVRRLPLFLGGLAAILVIVIAILVTRPGNPVETIPPTVAATTVPVVAEIKPSLTSTNVPPPTPTLTPVPPPTPLGVSNIYVEYILDASGSMGQRIGSVRKMDIAKRVLADHLRALPANTNVGFRVYGHRAPSDNPEKGCQDIELIAPIAPGRIEDIIARLQDLLAQGMTPIGASLQQAVHDFSFGIGNINSVILISDGEETCGQNPCELVRRLQEAGIKFTIHVIGFNVDEPTRQQLSCIAQNSGGTYHDATSAEALRSALTQIQQRAMASPTEPPVSAPATATTTSTAVPTHTSTPLPTWTHTPIPTNTPQLTDTPPPATSRPPDTPRPTNTPKPPTNTPVPPTNTPKPPTHTSIPPTSTPVPPTNTPRPTNAPHPTEKPPPTDTPPPYPYP